MDRKRSLWEIVMVVYLLVIVAFLAFVILKRIPTLIEESKKPYKETDCSIYRETIARNLPSRCIDYFNKTDK